MNTSQNPLLITGRPPDRRLSRGREPANQPATETETETMIPSFIDQTQTAEHARTGELVIALKRHS